MTTLLQRLSDSDNVSKSLDALISAMTSIQDGLKVQPTTVETTATPLLGELKNLARDSRQVLLDLGYDIHTAPETIAKALALLNAIKSTMSSFSAMNATGRKKRSASKGRRHSKRRSTKRRASSKPHRK